MTEVRPVVRTADQTTFSQLEGLSRWTRQFPRLTPDEEIVLGKEIQLGQQASQRLEAGDMIGAEQAEHHSLVQRGLAAETTFQLANLGLVGKQARFYYLNHPRGRSYGLMDIFQDGWFGLRTAVKKFDPDRGFKFSSFATPVIAQTILTCLNDKATTVYVPDAARSQIHKLTKLETTGQTDDQIQTELAIDRESLAGLREARLLGGEMISLDAPLPNVDDDFVYGDKVVDASSEAALEANLDGIDAADKGDSLSEQLRRLLTTFLESSDRQLIEKVIDEEELTASERRNQRRLRSLIEHPAIRAALKQLLPANSTISDWRDEAACVGYPEVFGQPRKHSKSEILRLCGGCAVRPQCRDYLLTEKPAKGHWAGHSASSRLKTISRRAA